MAQKKKTRTSAKTGVIPAVQEAKANAAQAVKEFLYGREEVITPGKIADENRKKGDDIVAELSNIDFAALKAVPGMKDETVEEMRNNVKALEIKIRNAPTIVDNLDALNTLLLSIAQTLRTAVKLGYSTQAEWCVNALSAGVLYLRDNVPPEHMKDRERIIAERTEYLKKYEKLIICYGMIDENEKSIEKLRSDLEEKKKVLEAKQAEVKAIIETPEGAKSWARIKANLNQLSMLSDGDQELNLKGVEVGDLAAVYLRGKNSLYAKTFENQTHYSEALDYRTALHTQPPLYSEDLLADHAALLQEMNQELNRMLTDAAKALQIGREMTNEMKTIMSGPAAQELARYSIKSIEQVMLPQNSLSEQELLEVKLQQAKLERARARHQQAETEVRNALEETNRAVNQSAETRQVIDFSEDVDTRSDVHCNTDEDTQENYNCNS